jgi:DNA-binding LytR/AlgR family response regulator
LKAVEKANQRMNVSTAIPTEIVVSEKIEPKQNFIFVKDGTKQIKVRLSDILYIESLKDYVRIYTKTQKIVSLLTMKALEAQLPETEFIRIHNSFIVSFEAIDAIDKEKVQIGETFLPVSDTYKKSFKEFIDGGSFGKNL